MACERLFMIRKEMHMTDSLARTNGGLTKAYSSTIPWTSFRDVFGFDPFENIRSHRAFDYDVSRTEGGYEVEVPVPGYKPEQIDVTFKDGLLSVNGNSERRTFSRSFTVPEDVDTDRIAARVADGMLVLVLERRPEAQPKRITVR
jgi:HSP20 family molecular chaperone IbpA